MRSNTAAGKAETQITQPPPSSTASPPPGGDELPWGWCGGGNHPSCLPQEDPSAGRCCGSDAKGGTGTCPPPRGAARRHTLALRGAPGWQQGAAGVQRWWGGKVSPPPCHLCSLRDTSGRGVRWGGGALEPPRAPRGHQEQAKAALGTAESTAPRGEGS